MSAISESQMLDEAESKVHYREEIAKYYLKKHRITDLFDNITAALVYQRPDDPKEFMIDYIKKLRDSKAAKLDYPSLFDETNVRSLFGIMDPAKKGYINHSQYKSGMENIGVSTYERNPPGSDEDQIGLDVFVIEAKEGLKVSNATFSPS
ncbi:EF-hand calcium-binding domain-containing protein 10-like [Clytia hemisphaerica]|uniref:EFCAB10 C-terminal EF-hand domain-containing protein n=1 Tax=Clytia hemisphaerica TaxID=252671 RepID=A0A7M5XPB7_9CNID